MSTALNPNWKQIFNFRLRSMAPPIPWRFYVNRTKIKFDLKLKPEPKNVMYICVHECQASYNTFTGRSLFTNSQERYKKKSGVFRWYFLVKITLKQGWNTRDDQKYNNKFYCILRSLASYILMQLWNEFTGEYCR